MYLNHNLAPLPKESHGQKYQPNPIKLQPYTAYMKEFNIQSKEDLQDRLQNAKENNLRRLELREKMRAGTIMLKKNFQK